MLLGEAKGVMRCLIAIVGPTAVGKSDLGLRLAQCIQVEIVNADSRQVRRYMDIGTSKPSPAQRALVPHHLIDIVNPDEEFSLATYCSLAKNAVEGIQRRGGLPLLVGGTGLYIWSLVEGWSIPRVPPDYHLRRQLESRARQEGSPALHEDLRQIDPVAAATIHPNNARRIIRALEIHQTTGLPPSQLLRSRKTPSFPTLIIGLTLERRELYRRIDRRVDRMLEAGLVEEVRGIVERGYGLDSPCMSAIGYREVGQFLRGELDLRTATERMRVNTHRMARRQYAWFRLHDARIHWFDAAESKLDGEVIDLCREFQVHGASDRNEQQEGSEAA